MAKILKFWHSYAWAIHAAAWITIFATLWWANNQNAVAQNTKDIASIQLEHKEENLNQRMAVQETLAKDTNDRLGRIETVQGKIFERINQVADERSVR